MIIKAKVLLWITEVTKDVENCGYWGIVVAKTKYGYFEYSQIYPNRQSAESFISDCVKTDYVEIEK